MAILCRPKCVKSWWTFLNNPKNCNDLDVNLRLQICCENGKETTYGELVRKCQAVATGLKKHGLKVSMKVKVSTYEQVQGLQIRDAIICNVGTVECLYNAVQFNKILHTSLQWLGQNTNKRLNLQKTHYTSPYRASYGVSYARILEKIDRVMTAPHCNVSYGLTTMACGTWPFEAEFFNHIFYRKKFYILLFQ